MALLQENAAFLKEFAADGLNLALVRAVEFAHVFGNAEDADAFAQAAATDEADIDVLEPEDDGDPWEVAVTLELLPTAETITEIEERLDALAQKHNGESDGWGLYDDE
ncbi:ribonuclease E inhibitor RraB [Novosphingobium sp.]|uniref:ribonuclease E inhibitor RraB n=1 Tax=Novosphingobium sp. TaxID=1874826 RepID=UPI0033409CDE